ncbi:MAG: DUF3352 domain-containing protein [Phycisphaerales bacterium]|nr:MAG: DUF3352 domain-containing protein [Phycisphaerales bacterium]
MFALGRKTLVWFVLALVGVAGGAHAGSSYDKFYKAYYLEREKGEIQAAADLYTQVVRDRGTDGALKSEANSRLADLREELAASDFAALMPPTSLAYIEFNQPGDQLLRLVDQLGLLADDEVGQDADKFTISPSIIRELLGIRGAAVAITGFDPTKGAPAGVVVFHPGDMEVIRGLLETALPLQTQVVEPIGGFATYKVENEAFVTLSERLVIASPQRSQIEAVIRRLRGEETTSLVTSADFGEVLAGRDDSLLFFFVNAEPLMPMLKGMMVAGAAQSSELAMAQALLDLNSLKSLVGRAGVGDNGLFLDVALRLDEGHKNLVFNLMRAPFVDRDVLANIPAGAAGFLVGALNDAQTSRTLAATSQSDGTPIVTLLDFGREIFANITSFAIYALPPQEGQATGGTPIPDIALAIAVSDPARSKALWMEVLGIAGIAAGARSIEGVPATIEGVTVYAYQFPENVTVHFAVDGDNVLVTSTRAAMAATLRAKRSGRSVLNDAAFSEGLALLGPDTVEAFMAHPGRIFEIAKPFIPPGEAAEVQQVAGMLTDTVVSYIVTHNDNMFRISAAVTNLPQVGEFVAQMIAKERNERQAFTRVDRAMSAGNWAEAVAEVDALIGKYPDRRDLLRKKFDALTRVEDKEAAIACGEKILIAAYENAQALNSFAWALLTDDDYSGAYADLALKLSQRSNELTDFDNWYNVDTLALATFETGDVATAVELQKKAVKLADGEDGGELTERLERFESALQSH